MTRARTIVRRLLATYDATGSRLRAFAAEPVPQDPDAQRAPTVSLELAGALDHEDRRQELLAARAAQRAEDEAAIAALVERETASIAKHKAEMARLDVEHAALKAAEADAELDHQVRINQPWRTSGAAFWILDVVMAARARDARDSS